MINKIDFKKAGELCVQMANIHRKMTELFPPESEVVLKHLDASSIHLAFFMIDLADITCERKTKISNEKEFLEKCGCDFNKEKE